MWNININSNDVIISHYFYNLNSFKQAANFTNTNTLIPARTSNDMLSTYKMDLLARPFPIWTVDVWE